MVDYKKIFNSYKNIDENIEMIIIDDKKLIKDFYKINEYRKFENLKFYKHDLSYYDERLDKHAVVYFPNGYGVSVTTEKDSNKYYAEIVARNTNIMSEKKKMIELGFTLNEETSFTEDINKITDLMLYVQKMPFAVTKKVIEKHFKRALQYDRYLNIDNRHCLVMHNGKCINYVFPEKDFKYCQFRSLNKIFLTNIKNKSLRNLLVRDLELLTLRELLIYVMKDPRPFISLMKILPTFGDKALFDLIKFIEESDPDRIFLGYLKKNKKISYTEVNKIKNMYRKARVFKNKRKNKKVKVVKNGKRKK